MKACVAVAEKDVNEAVRSCLAAQERGADLVEVRFDLMDRLPEDLAPFKQVKVPKIATLRTADQGGRCALDDEARLRFFRRVVRGGFEHIDLEVSSSLMRRADHDLRGANVIASYHDFEKTPKVSKIVETLVSVASHGRLVKAAFMVRSVSDLHDLVSAAKLFSQTQHKFILLGMGELGEVTRLLSDRMGCEFTYAALERGKETAPGQMDIATLKGLGQKPIITGLTGQPLGHSYSAKMHDAAFEALGIPGRYLKFPCSEEELGQLMSVMRDLGINGMNVTIPHKESVMEHLDEVDPTAKNVGAVNVIVNKDGRLIGRNTDVTGLAAAFGAAGADVRGKRALVIGAGGAARAFCSFLRDQKADIWITNRTISRAEEVAEDFSAQTIGHGEAASERFDAVINCTPLGMAGFPHELPIDPRVFRPGQVVMDAIYNPRITPFLAEAGARGAKTISGMEMLIYQAMDAFEAWTGQRPAYEVMSGAAGQ